LVSSNSITGSTNAISFQTDYYQRIQSMKLQNPHLIGFGVHDRKTFETVCEFGSGAIIGSAFIKHLKANGTSKESIQGFVDGIKV
jgi:tryptophan synthase alpha chain